MAELFFFFQNPDLFYVDTDLYKFNNQIFSSARMESLILLFTECEIPEIPDKLHVYTHEMLVSICHF